MSTIVDSYSESNQSSDFTLSSDETGHTYFGQSFTGDGGTLESAKFYIKKSGSPTGNINVYIYTETHATAFGTDSLPTGSVLATSDNFDVTTLTTSYTLTSFTFSGAEKITLTNGTKYVVAVKYDATVSSTGSLIVGYDSTSPTHAGNVVRFFNFNTTWYAQSGYDCCFYIYKDSTTVIQDIIGGLIPFVR